KGGVNLKRIFGDDALAVFIKAPSIEVLRQRLVSRNTDTPQAIETRLAKAEEELSYAPHFDIVLVNDQLEECLAAAEKLPIFDGEAV
ncbi:MAG: guanylate kinase, partial [Bacteroidales bacterium]|nr:guanylate kinase [Bacteroidales bacterium]